MEEDELVFDWAVLTALLLDPLKVAIIEALGWIGEPLSATDLRKLFDLEFSLSLVSYHLVQLGKKSVLVEVRNRQVRGSVERFYFFP